MEAIDGLFRLGAVVGQHTFNEIIQKDMILWMPSKEYLLSDTTEFNNKHF